MSNLRREREVIALTSASTCHLVLIELLLEAKAVVLRQHHLEVAVGTLAAARRRRLRVMLRVDHVNLSACVLKLMIVERDIVVVHVLLVVGHRRRASTACLVRRLVCRGESTEGVRHDLNLARIRLLRLKLHGGRLGCLHKLCRSIRVDEVLGPREPHERRVQRVVLRVVGCQWTVSEPAWWHENRRAAVAGTRRVELLRRSLRGALRVVVRRKGLTVNRAGNLGAH